MNSRSSSHDFIERLAIERLASQMLDSGMSEKQRAELFDCIQDDAEACDRFADHVLHATLRKELGAHRPVTLGPPRTAGCLHCR